MLRGWCFFLVFTGDIFLTGYAGQEASGLRPMWYKKRKNYVVQKILTNAG
jgi:hypothetical protein